MPLGINSDWAESSPACRCIELRKEIIAQRKEIISLLRSLGQELTQGMDSSTYPKWIRDRLIELGEEV